MADSSNYYYDIVCIGHEGYKDTWKLILWTYDADDLLSVIDSTISNSKAELEAELKHQYKESYPNLQKGFYPNY